MKHSALNPDCCPPLNPAPLPYRKISKPDIENPPNTESLDPKPKRKAQILTRVADPVNFSHTRDSSVHLIKGLLMDLFGVLAVYVMGS